MRQSLCPNRYGSIDPSGPLRALLASKAMNDNNNSMIDTELQRLDVRVSELLSLVQQLTDENRALRHRQDSLSNERSALLQKNEQVRTRVEAMIGRLRLLETGT
jgi:cell division protein ZapB